MILIWLTNVILGLWFLAAFATTCVYLNIRKDCEWAPTPPCHKMPNSNLTRCILIMSKRAEIHKDTGLCRTIGTAMDAFGWIFLAPLGGLLLLSCALCCCFCPAGEEDAKEEEFCDSQGVPFEKVEEEEEEVTPLQPLYPSTP